MSPTRAIKFVRDGHFAGKAEGLFSGAVTGPDAVANNISGNAEQEVVVFEEQFEALWRHVLESDDRELMSSLRRLEGIRDRRTGRRLRLAHTLRLIDSISYALIFVCSSVVDRFKGWIRTFSEFLNGHLVLGSISAACALMITTSLLGLGPLKFHFESFPGRAPASPTSVSAHSGPDFGHLAEKGEFRSNARWNITDRSIGTVVAPARPAAGVNRRRYKLRRAALRRSFVSSSAAPLSPCSGGKCADLPAGMLVIASDGRWEALSFSAGSRSTQIHGGRMATWYYGRISQKEESIAP